MSLCSTCGGEDARAALSDTIERLVIANAEKERALKDEMEATVNLGRCFLKYQSTCVVFQAANDLLRKQQYTTQCLRNVVKLMIGRQTNVSWTQIPAGEVDAYLVEMERLEALQIQASQVQS